MSHRLKETFAKKPAERPLFVPYVTAAYPTREATVPVLLAMEAGGADVVELGLPFTDPMADGATIQHANEIALKQGDVSFGACLELVKDARAAGLTVPLLLMGYYNSVLAYGEERAAHDAAAAGADGFIVVDLPPDEAGTFVAACRAADMSFVPLVAPTTRDERIAELAASADAFLYCVSLTGTTGTRQALSEDLGAFLARVRKQSDLPLAVGFGISTREHVEQVGAIAEAAVVGSAIISTLDEAGPGQGPAAVRVYIERVTGRK